jgi:hypothetical protein
MKIEYRTQWRKPSLTGETEWRKRKSGNHGIMMKGSRISGNQESALICVYLWFEFNAYLKKQTQFARSAFSVMSIASLFCHSRENRNPVFLG